MKSRNNIECSPKISIIMATYNRGQIISEAIESVLNQTFKNFELIIIDDGSTDNTKNVVRGYKDPRIVYLKRRHSGLVASKNYGLKIAKGRYIAYCDDDCIFYPDHLWKLSLFLDNHPEFGMVYSDGLHCLGNNDLILKSVDFNKRRLEGYCFFMVLSAMHRKECLDRVGYFDERLLARDDWDMWLKVSDFYLIAHLPETTGKHTYYHNISTLTKKINQGLYRELVVRKRIKKAKQENRLLEYINGCSIGMIKNLVRYDNIKYALNLSKFFLETVKNYQTLACLGICNLAKGKVKEAGNLLQESLKRLPKRWAALDSWTVESILTIKVNSARAYYLSGKIDKALELSKESLKAMPDNTEAKIELARCYAKKGFYKDALNLIDGINLNADAYNLAGYCYFRLKEYKKAIRKLNNAVRVDPDVIIYRRNLEYIYNKFNLKRLPRI